ncbi:hypothetical protein F2Q69_00047822 [Brassica cretica]|uniref:Uncharacterized protein n=1 Tax=Brassica cretica TaxID=69181 RepID=A0A8S9PWR4_BRACR|nr:hypothetical protein F2Q69_00047822 [Brassica cretica]
MRIGENGRAMISTTHTGGSTSHAMSQPSPDDAFIRKSDIEALIKAINANSARAHETTVPGSMRIGENGRAMISTTHTGGSTSHAMSQPSPDDAFIRKSDIEALIKAINANSEAVHSDHEGGNQPNFQVIHEEAIHDEAIYEEAI